MLKYWGVLSLVCLEACSPSASKSYFCEAQNAQPFDGFIRHYTVQNSPDRLCVSWAADVIHCGVFGNETTTSWVVNNATGTKSQLSYQAKMNVESVELTITRQDVLLLSPSTDEFAHSVVSDFEFSKNTLRLATRLDIRDPAAVIYNCSNWQKKPWWEWS